MKIEKINLYMVNIWGKNEGKVNSNRTWEWLQIEPIKKEMEGLLLRAQEEKKQKQM